MKMITVAAREHHRIAPISLYIIFIILSPQITNLVGAQSGDRVPPNNASPSYASFTPSIAIIIAVLIAALFFMGFFSIYIRHCSDAPGGSNVARRALSMRNRRAPAARGLEASVLETFPMFSYSEVKDHKIAKGALECAVCLCEFEDHETLRLIPKCDHVFHPECIDAWLEFHVTCPVCRANLIPQPGDEPFKLQADNNTGEHNSTTDRSNSINEEFVVQVDGRKQNQEPKVNRNLSMEIPNRLPRSWSMKMFGRGKFRSHSTGHSVVQPGENLDRFTLRLPAHVRKEVMDRAALNRTGSCIGENSKREYTREGSSRVGRFNRIDDSEAKSDMWVFFRRAFSMRSPKVVAENGQGSSREGSSKIPVKLPSFKCLEPRAADETVLFSGEHSVTSPV